MNRNSVRIKDSKREAKALILDGITVKFIELLSLFDGYDSNETKIRSSSSKLLVVEAFFGPSKVGGESDTGANDTANSPGDPISLGRFVAALSREVVTEAETQLNV
ncbi:hypothetical protein ACMD2_22575 [Ananas comosus]|uniref:Uncharacterized protein n=1 Tax=Ananas comosus TaxID=4615 RepID=A0A199V6U2_ANACO|nr:hypothetical protein ACMD2_22575 [Ananas comosus]